MVESSVGKERGFSLLEALVVLALIAVLVLILIPNLTAMYRAYRVDTAASQLAMNLRFARNAAVARRVTYRVSVVQNDGSALANSYSITTVGGAPQPVIQRGLLEDIPTQNSPVIFEGKSPVSIDFAPTGAATASQLFVITDVSGVKHCQVSVVPSGQVEVTDENGETK